MSSLRLPPSNRCNPWKSLLLPLLWPPTAIAIAKRLPRLHHLLLTPFCVTIHQTIALLLVRKTRPDALVERTGEAAAVVVAAAGDAVNLHESYRRLRLVLFPLAVS
jgi:hypothetical protein